ncbi:T9SS type A sorting domain-containing protein [Saccharicrinis sp. FJH62]|uniref:T9SS type A sorting domain-containing protein n=1 Tax=Saccharicrinis sp. FJH62 TaxID=3344657 RepID=UPI0035D438D9
MLKLKLSLTILFFLCMYVKPIQAQENVNTAGGMATGSGGSASYSIGQLTCHTHAGTNGSMAEGVQQPYKIMVVTELKEAQSINLTISAYPIPAINHLTLDVKDFKLSNMHFQLYDISGKLLLNEKITNTQTSIDVSKLVPAIYLVKVFQGQQEVKTFKITKN